MFLDDRETAKPGIVKSSLELVFGASFASFEVVINEQDEGEILADCDT